MNTIAPRSPLEHDARALIALNSEILGSMDNARRTQARRERDVILHCHQNAHTTVALMDEAARILSGSGTTRITKAA